ncbi:MAG TPA: hypothetical protein VLK36_04600 [Gaiellaceae bacterium]|nr:hypothetical protein [Gaiellaceae bacterium]
MLALPAHPGRIGALLLAVGLLLGAVVAVVVWRRLRRSLAGHEAATAVAALVAFVLASTVAAAPFVAWRIVEDARYTSALTRAEAERAGGESAHVDPEVIAALGRRMPADATYAVVASPVVGGQVTAFSQWAGYALLPRTQVGEPARAEWILSWDRNPRSLGVPLRAVRTRVTAGGPAPHTYYLARVRR